MKRGSGVLLSITSLPSPYGIGDLGPWACKFADFLHRAKQSYWQILPINPTISSRGHSPYHSSSAFAGNKLLISLEFMIRDGFLNKKDIKSAPRFKKNSVDYQMVASYKKKVFERAYERFERDTDDEYEDFCFKNASWLDDFAIFTALKNHFETCWSEWPGKIRDRHPVALKDLTAQLSDKINMEKFLQYIFFKQWGMLKQYCNNKGIKLIGDIPIYVDYDSADVWANPEIFKLNGKKQPTHISGVPPDYFSNSGQLWGHPVYKWGALKKQRYGWWIQRIGHNLRLYDWIRIDHFRGFVAYWEIQAGKKTAVEGKWVKAPAKDLFNELSRNLPRLPLIAEDLGVITPDVRQLMDCFGFPGMRVLLFAFNEDTSDNIHAPHNYIKNCVVYTGTHDNNTVRGWFENEAAAADKKRLLSYLGHDLSVNSINWDFIRLAMMSVSNAVIFPIQDILGLGEAARMNRPGTVERNWQWRILPKQLSSSLFDSILKLTKIYGRV